MYYWHLYPWRKHRNVVVLTVRGVRQGKVRDTYEVGDKLVIVTTDRQSAFDRILASIPYKVCTHSLLCMLMNDV